MPRLLRRLPLAPPFLRNSLLRLMMGVSLNGRAIICDDAPDVSALGVASLVLMEFGWALAS
jgi:hypothetical protein